MVFPALTFLDLSDFDLRFPSPWICFYAYLGLVAAPGPGSEAVAILLLKARASANETRGPTHGARPRLKVRDPCAPDATLAWDGVQPWTLLVDTNGDTPAPLSHVPPLQLCRQQWSGPPTLSVRESQTRRQTPAPKAQSHSK